MSNEYRAKIYDRYVSRFQNEAETFDLQAAERWGKAYDYYFRGWLTARKDAAIAELACGRGYMLHYLKVRGYSNLRGIDISPEQVALARQVLACVEQGDAVTFLEANKGQFQLVIALDLLEHFQKDEALRFLAAAYGSLKPGGGLILQTPNAGSPWHGDTLYGDFTHEICLNANGIRRILRLSGFNAVEVRETGPIPWGYSLSSSIRACAWQCLRTLHKATAIIETGSAGDAIYTRNLLVRASQ
jgi:SAM-dependent methyltransferase